MGIATALEWKIDILLSSVVSTASSNLITMLYPVAVTGVTLYIILMGYAALRGNLHEPVMAVAWKIMVVSIVIGIAFAEGAYQANVVGFINSVPGVIASAMGGGATTLGGVIDGAFDPLLDLVAEFYKQAMMPALMPDFSLMFAALTVGVAGVVLVVVAVGTAITLKVMLTLALAVGPVFTLLLAFPAFHSKFEAWLSTALSLALGLGLLGATVAMLTPIAQGFIDLMAADPGAGNHVVDSLSLLGIVVALCFAIMGVESLAAQMTGGVNTYSSGVGAGLAGGAASGAMKVFQKMMNREKSQAPNAITSRGRSNAPPGVQQPQAGGAGRGYGVTRPAYQRNVLNNIRRSAK